MFDSPSRRGLGETHLKIRENLIEELTGNPRVKL